MTDPLNVPDTLRERWWGATVRFPHRFVLAAFGIAIVLLLLIFLRGLLQTRDSEVESLRQMQIIRANSIHALLDMEAERLRSVRNFAEHLLRIQSPAHAPDGDVRAAFAHRDDASWSLPSHDAAGISGTGGATLAGLEGFTRRDSELMLGLDMARSLSHLLGAAPETTALRRRMAYVSSNGFVVSRPFIAEDQVAAALRRYAAAPYFRDSLPEANPGRTLKWRLAQASDGSSELSMFMSVPVYAGDSFRGVAISEISRRSLDDYLSHSPYNDVRSFLIDRNGALLGASVRNVKPGETLGTALRHGWPDDTLATIFRSGSGVLRATNGSRLIFHKVTDSGLAMVDVVSTKDLMLRSASRLSGAIAAGAAALGILLCATLMVVHTLFKHYLARGEALRALAETDALTGLANRRAFNSRFALEYAYGAREQLPVSLIMLDIDHFKRINDHWGHASGDIVLRQLSAALRGNVRSVDLPARLGGEEFGILLPRTALAEAAAIAEQLRQAVEQLACEPAKDAVDKGSIRFTASFGVAQIIPDGTNDLQTLVLAADQRLYAAKAGGRNRVVAQ